MIDPQTGLLETVQLGSPRRLRTIYDANMRAAYAAGQWARFERVKSALPYLIYELGPSEEHRPEHAARAGTIRPVDDSLWRSWAPPNGWGCKCRLRQLTRAQAKRLGGASDPPDIPTRQWENKRTGEIKEIPEGIDPGWERNPGRERARWMERLLAGKLDDAPPDIRRTLVADMVGSWRFERIYDGSASGAVPIAALPAELGEALGVASRIALFSDDAARRARETHPEVKPQSYARLQAMLDDGPVWRRENGDLMLIDEGAGWVAILEAAKDQSEVYLQTLYRAASQSDPAALKDQAERIR